MKQLIALFCLAGFSASFSVAVLATPQEEQAVRILQTEWAQAKYQAAKDEQEKAFEALQAKADDAGKQLPDSAPVLIWRAIVLSTHAGVKGGLGALSLVKQARDLLEQAEKIDAKALNGSVYTSLGSLYYQVPGWPIGFGDDEKAEQYLKQALAVNPERIDPNFFYGDYLREQGRYRESLEYLQKAMIAPARPDRPLADKGRREEIEVAMRQVRAELAE